MYMFWYFLGALLTSLPAQALIPTCDWAGRSFSGAVNDFEDLGTRCNETFGGGPVSLSFDLSVSTPHYSRIFDFGGPEYQVNIFANMKRDGNMAFQANSRGKVIIDANPFQVFQRPVHVFWILEVPESRVYLNGLLAGTIVFKADITRTNRTLLVAKSHQIGTPLFEGNVTNFKLWDGAAAACADTGGCTWTSSTSTSSTSSTTLSTAPSTSTSSSSLSTSSSSVSSSSVTTESTLTSTSGTTTVSSTSSLSSVPSSSVTTESTLTSKSSSTIVSTTRELPLSSAALTTVAGEFSTMTSRAGATPTTAEFAMSSQTATAETMAVMMAVTSTASDVTSGAEDASTTATSSPAPATPMGVSSAGAARASTVPVPTMVDLTTPGWDAASTLGNLAAASSIAIATTPSLLDAHTPPDFSSSAPAQGSVAAESPIAIATTPSLLDAATSPDISSAAPGIAAGTSPSSSPASTTPAHAADATSADWQAALGMSSTPLPNATSSMPSPSNVSAAVAASSGLSNALLLQEKGVLNDLGGKSEIVRRIPGATIAAFALDLSAAAATVSAAGWHVVLPLAGLFDPGAEAVATASIPDLETVPEVSPDILFSGVASFNLYEDGRRLSVKNLAEPIVITVPVADPSKVSSVLYWDEEELQWLGHGMAIRSKGTNMVSFSTTHLTLFAAVWQGFLSTLACAQLGMLSLEGLQALGSGEWFLGHVALCFWALLLFLLLTIVQACRLDKADSECWGDTVFIVPQHVMPAAGAAAITATAVTMANSPSTASDFVPGTAMRDALDEVCSTWMEYFGEVRDLLEAVCAGLSCENISLAQLGLMAGRAVGALVAESARRQACGALSLSEEVVSFVLEDEEMGQVLLEAALRSQKESMPDCLKAWLEMHERVLAGIDSVWQQELSLRAAVRLFTVSQPLLACFKPCPLTTRSMRVLMLVCDILGQMTLAALFFEGSGMAISRKASQLCEAGESTGFGGLVGRMAAIVLVSAFLANLPVSVLASLHNRSCRKVAYEGCPQWHRQLRVWRLQDRLIWSLAGFYILACTFFLVLFLGNIGPEGLDNYALAALIQVLQQLLVIPLVMSVVLPFLRTVSLCALSRAQHRPPSLILAEQRQEKEEAGGNWKPFIITI